MQPALRASELVIGGSHLDFDSGIKNPSVMVRGTLDYPHQNNFGQSHQLYRPPSQAIIDMNPVNMTGS